MNFELFVAMRYLKGRRKGFFTLITSGIAVGGVTLGIAALIITLAVMNGFHNEIQKRILGVQSHIVVAPYFGGGFSGYDKICRDAAKIKGVESCAPFIYTQAVIRKGRQSIGIVIKGVPPRGETSISRIAEYVKNTSFEKLSGKQIIFGKALARSLGATAGDDIFLVTMPEDQPLINIIPKIDRLTVAGIFDSGMYDYDSSVAYIPLDTAQKIFSLQDRVTGIGIRTVNPKKAPEIAREITVKLRGFTAQPWQETNKNLFSALKLEKIMMFIILALIVIVASFNIISNLLLFSIEKVRDIGILTALGATRKVIGKIFFWEGILIGVTGIIIGTTLGTAISLLLGKYPIIKLPPDIYYIDKIPLRVSFSDVLAVLAAAIIIVLVSTLYPAKKAAETDPLDAIRYG